MKSFKTWWGIRHIRYHYNYWRWYAAIGQYCEHYGWIMSQADEEFLEGIWQGKH